MRVLVAGGTGVIGRQLLPLLTAVGHEVSVLTRADGDLLDADVVARAVRRARPEAVVHMATAIPARIDPKRQAAQFEQTNRLRTEGLRNLVRAAGPSLSRLVVQGLAFAYRPGPDTAATEDEPLWLDAPAQFRPAVAALAEMEAVTADAGGLVLRLGHLYGPGSIYAPDGSFTAQVRAGKVPLAGRGASTFSFLHAYDAATAVLAALDRPAVGALNVVDDDPAPMGDWLLAFAGMIGANPPRRVPVWLARLAGGSWGAAYLTRLRGADNTRARAELDWKPRHVSWRTGFAQEHRADEVGTQRAS